MLAHVLALAVALASFTLYMAAFFLPEVYRKFDFIWSGVAMFYALVLWVYAPEIRGGLLIGHTACVVLLGWMGWQVLQMRRQMTPLDQRTWLPEETRSPFDVLQYQFRQIRSKLPGGSGTRTEPQIPTAVLERSPQPASDQTTSPKATQASVSKPSGNHTSKARYKRSVQPVGVNQVEAGRLQTEGFEANRGRIGNAASSEASGSKASEEVGKETGVNVASAKSRIQPSAGTSAREVTSTRAERPASGEPSQPQDETSDATSLIADKDSPDAAGQALKDAAFSEGEGTVAGPTKKKRSIIVLPRTKKKNLLEKIQDWVGKTLGNKAVESGSVSVPSPVRKSGEEPKEDSFDDFDFDFNEAPALVLEEAATEVTATEATTTQMTAVEVVGVEPATMAIEVEPLEEIIATIVTDEESPEETTLQETTKADTAIAPADITAPPQSFSPQLQEINFDEIDFSKLEIVTSAQASSLPEIPDALTVETVEQALEELSEAQFHDPISTSTRDTAAASNFSMGAIVAEELAISEAIAEKIIEAGHIEDPLTPPDRLTSVDDSPVEQSAPMTSTVAVDLVAEELAISEAIAEKIAEARHINLTDIPAPSKQQGSDESKVADLEVDIVVGETTDTFSERSVVEQISATEESTGSAPISIAASETAGEVTHPDLDSIFVLPPDVPLIEEAALPETVAPEETIELQEAILASRSPEVPLPDLPLPIEAPPELTIPGDDEQMPQVDWSFMQVGAPPGDEAEHEMTAKLEPNFIEAVTFAESDPESLHATTQPEPPPSQPPDFVSELRELLQQSEIGIGADDLPDISPSQSEDHFSTDQPSPRSTFPRDSRTPSDLTSALENLLRASSSTPESSESNWSD